MNEVLKHLGVFLGIISFFSGIIVLTVNYVFCNKKENRYYRILRTYHLAFFAYLLTIFAYYYVEQFFPGESQYIFIDILGNITLACLCIAHAKIITFLNGTENSRRFHILEAANIFYVAGWILINLMWIDSDGYMHESAGVVVTWLVEGTVLAVLVYFALQEYRVRRKEKWLYFFLGVFAVEYIWEVMYDLAIAEPFFRFTFLVSPFNIIFIIYILVNGILLAGLYRKFLTGRTEEAEEKQEQGENREIHQAERFDEKTGAYGLTARECEILQLILDRKSNQEIADQLFISNNTVKHHVSNIFKKTNVNRRTELQKLFSGDNAED